MLVLPLPKIWRYSKQIFINHMLFLLCLSSSVTYLWQWSVHIHIVALVRSCWVGRFARITFILFLPILGNRWAAVTVVLFLDVAACVAFAIRAVVRLRKLWCRCINSYATSCAGAQTFKFVDRLWNEGMWKCSLRWESGIRFPFDTFLKS